MVLDIVQAHANDILGFTKYQNAFKSVDEYDQKNSKTVL